MDVKDLNGEHYNFSDGIERSDIAKTIYRVLNNPELDLVTEFNKILANPELSENACVKLPYVPEVEQYTTLNVLNENGERV